MKHKTLKLGICLLALGLAGIIFCGCNSKININKMTAADWENCGHINGIGMETIEKLENNIPFDRIQDVEKIGGIGATKAAIIERHFCTYDTCRFEFFVVALPASCALVIVGTLLIICVFIRRKYDAEILKELIKKD